MNYTKIRGSEKNRFLINCFVFPYVMEDLLGTCVFGYGLGTFTYGVFRQFTGQKEPHCRLNFPAGNCGPLIVMGESRSFGGDTFEDIVDEAVHDAHGLTGNTGIGMYLFEYFVDVDCVALLSPALLLFVALRDVLLGLSCLFGSFTASFWWHLVSLRDRTGYDTEAELWWVFTTKLYI